MFKHGEVCVSGAYIPGVTEDFDDMSCMIDVNGQAITVKNLHKIELCLRHCVEDVFKEYLEKRAKYHREETERTESSCEHDWWHFGPHDPYDFGEPWWIGRCCRKCHKQERTGSGPRCNVSINLGDITRPVGPDNPMNFVYE